MNHPVPVAQSHACRNCGGTIAVTGAPTVLCPHCQFRQEVPRELLARLRDYQADASRLESRIQSEHSAKAKWAMWYGQDGKAQHAWFAPLAMIAGMGLVVGLCFLLLQAGVLNSQTMQPAMTMGILGTYVLGFALYGLWALRNKPASSAPRPLITTQCPLCGGTLPFECGAIGRSCPHCGGSLVADAPVMHHALGVAEFQLEQARMARYRLERTAMRRVYGSSVGTLVPYIVLGSFLPLSLVGVVMATAEALDGQLPPVAALLAWTFGACHIGLLFAIYRFRAWRRGRYRCIAEQASSGIGGSVHTESATWVWWLNSFWAGDYPVSQLLKGPYFHVILGNVYGYPVAIDMDPVPVDSNHGKARADVLLAARVSPQFDCAPIAPDLRAQATALGFSLQSNSGGFIATGQQPSAILRNTPNDTAQLFVRVAYLLAECAHRAGTPPAQPFPQDVG